MEIKTEIKISKHEIIDLIKKEYNIADGDISFILKENLTQCGFCSDGGYQYKSDHTFDYVKIIQNKQSV
jgi:hypothetical protein